MVLSSFVWNPWIRAMCGRQRSAAIVSAVRARCALYPYLRGGRPRQGRKLLNLPKLRTVMSSACAGELTSIPEAPLW